MKDPAFLFYSQDFLIGTAELSNEETGQYIRILAYMHQKGRMAEKTVISLVGPISELIRAKFKLRNGVLFNTRLEEESTKRQKFVESRRKNATKKKKNEKHMPEHMEDENENESSSLKKGIVKGGKHSFKGSPFFDKKVFQENLGLDIHETAFWWHSLNDYSEQGNKYLNWLVTARTWKRKAESKGDVSHKAYRIPKPRRTPNQTRQGAINGRGVQNSEKDTDTPEEIEAAKKAINDTKTALDKMRHKSPKKESLTK